MLRTFLFVIFFLSLTLTSCSSQEGSEAISRNPASLNDGGFISVPVDPSAEFTVPDARSLKWPVQFQDQDHQIGNSMAQFQPYDGSYWHGGCDLRVNAGAPIHSPVSGRIEAGHYTYGILPDGSMKKYWLAWPKLGNKKYFEVAVIDDHGVRYEFHHVNRDTLPAHVIDALQSGKRINAGELLGFAIRWSDGVYHHIHYNIVAPNGVRINPEYVSEELHDITSPEVANVYAIAIDGAVSLFRSGDTVSNVSELVVDVSDIRGAYEHPPTRSQLIFANGETVVWDFSKTLTTTSGHPKLYDFFKKSIITPSGVQIKTTGGYGTGTSLVRFPISPSAKGAFTMRFEDQNGNSSSLSGFVN